MMVLSFCVVSACSCIFISIYIYIYSIIIRNSCRVENTGRMEQLRTIHIYYLLT